jgi:hypothetical protein
LTTSCATDEPVDKLAHGSDRRIDVTPIQNQDRVANSRLSVAVHDMQVFPPCDIDERVQDKRHDEACEQAHQRTSDADACVSARSAASSRQNALDWHLVATNGELARHGDFITCAIFGTPIIVRRHDDQLVAFVNVCAHRHARLTHIRCGSSERLRCQISAEGPSLREHFGPQTSRMIERWFHTELRPVRQTMMVCPIITWAND